MLQLWNSFFLRTFSKTRTQGTFLSEDNSCFISNASFSNKLKKFTVSFSSQDESSFSDDLLASESCGVKKSGSFNCSFIAEDIVIGVSTSVTDAGMLNVSTLVPDKGVLGVVTFLADDGVLDVSKSVADDGVLNVSKSVADDGMLDVSKSVTDDEVLGVITFETDLKKNFETQSFFYWKKFVCLNKTHDGSENFHTHANKKNKCNELL